MEGVYRSLRFTVLRAYFAPGYRIHHIVTGNVSLELDLVNGEYQSSAQASQEWWRRRWQRSQETLERRWWENRMNDIIETTNKSIQTSVNLSLLLWLGLAAAISVQDGIKCDELMLMLTDNASDEWKPGNFFINDSDSAHSRVCDNLATAVGKQKSLWWWMIRQSTTRSIANCWTGKCAVYWSVVSYLISVDKEAKVSYLISVDREEEVQFWRPLLSDPSDTKSYVILLVLAGNIF